VWKFIKQIINDPTFGFIWGLIGFLIGNRLSIDRDRRREFNNLIDPIRRDLVGGIYLPGSSKYKSWMMTFPLIREKLSFWKKRGLDRAVENYTKSIGDENRESDGGGGFNYKNKEIIDQAAKEILKFLKPK